MHATDPSRTRSPGPAPALATARAGPSPLPGEPNPRPLREALGRFATGVTVLTAGAPGGPLAGLTANAFSSVSLDPPLVLVCVKAASRSLGVIRARGCFAVHVLAAADRALAQAFARPGTDKFAGIELTFGARGAPRLPDHLARFECALEREHPGGDHRILIGRVLHIELPERPAEPLIFYRSRLGACTCAADEARICYT